MKILVPFILVLVLSISCSRESPPQVNGTVRYKINGNEKLIEAKFLWYYETVSIKKEFTLPPATEYFYSFYAAQSSVGFVGVKFRTDALALKTYHFDSLSLGPPLFPHATAGNDYETANLYYSGDFFTITFTSLSGGKASGTFSGKLSPWTVPMDHSTHGTINITDGSFTDIPFYN